MDPVLAADLSQQLLQMYSQAEQDMLRRVSNRLGRGIDTPGWTEAKLAEVQALNRELEQVVNRVDRVASRELGQLVTNAYQAGSGSALSLTGPALTSADDFGARITLAQTAGAFGRTHIAAMEALYAEAYGNIRRGNQMILRGTLDHYRAVVAGNVGMGVGGVLTRQQVTQRMLNQWADMGVTGFRDRAGRMWSMPAYAEMTARTAITSAHLQGRHNTLADQGFDVVKVSDSPEECPLCRPWEGQILSISGKDPDIPSVQEAKDAGLFHGNCGHSTFLYTPGMEEHLQRPRSNARGYEERQKQRALERDIRRWKNREAVALTPQEKAYARARVRAAQARMRNFTDTTGRRRLSHREAVGGARIPKGAVPTPVTPKLPRPAGILSQDPPPMSIDLTDARRSGTGSSGR